MKRFIVPLLAIALASFVGACSDDSSSPATMGTLSIRITDAPANYEQVNITFAEIAAHVDGRWVVVSASPVTINLLEWNNGNSVEVGRADLGPGKCTQIRLMVTHAEVVVGGVTHTLDIPSADQTGLKLITNFDIVAGSTYELILDFDAHRSIITTGPPFNPTGYKLRPTIRVIEQAMTGSIKGIVTNLEHPALATASQGGVLITSTPVTMVNGEFRLAFLAAGDYDVRVEDILGNFYEQSAIEVLAGRTSDIGNITLE